MLLCLIPTGILINESQQFKGISHMAIAGDMKLRVCRSNKPQLPLFHVYSMCCKQRSNLLSGGNMKYFYSSILNHQRLYIPQFTPEGKVPYNLLSGGNMTLYFRRFSQLRCRCYSGAKLTSQASTVVPTKTRPCKFALSPFSVRFVTFVSSQQFTWLDSSGIQSCCGGYISYNRY